MKIKIFNAGNGEVPSIENEVNEFIQDKKVVDIKMSESLDGHTQTSSLTLVIIYE